MPPRAVPPGRQCPALGAGWCDAAPRIGPHPGGGAGDRGIRTRAGMSGHGNRSRSVVVRRTGNGGAPRRDPGSTFTGHRGGSPMFAHFLRYLQTPLRRAIAGLVLTTALVALSAPVLAGGYAVVRLDEPPGDVLVATPWRFGFMVLQHDISPTSDVTPVVRALHKETGEEVTATGRQEGAVGHFVAEVTFPRAGEWKWSIEPLPYAETSFETLTVLVSPSALSYPARIVTGTCAAPGDIAYSLGDVAPQAITEKSASLPVAIGV